MDVAVPRGHVGEYVVVLDAPNTVRWSVAVAGGFDVQLELLYIESGGGGGVVRPSSRVKEDSGTFVAAAAGRLLFKLDNSFSMLRGKTVKVTVSLGAHGFSAADVRDSELMNDKVMAGIELFFTNRFAEAERFFAAEKDRVRSAARCGACRSPPPPGLTQFPGGLDTPSSASLPARRCPCTRCATPPCPSCARS